MSKETLGFSVDIVIKIGVRNCILRRLAKTNHLSSNTIFEQITFEYNSIRVSELLRGPFVRVSEWIYWCERISPELVLEADEPVQDDGVAVHLPHREAQSPRLLLRLAEEVACNVKT